MVAAVGFHIHQWRAIAAIEAANDERGALDADEIHAG